jgi:deoxyribodipyrimidine photo-lyase
VINKSLKKLPFAKVEKFIQEVLWRVYWKGWLELRPNVWTDFLIELKEVKKEFNNNQNYLNAS